MRLSEADYTFINEMRESGVFEDVIPEKLQANSRMVVCQCGDGHRFRDWFKHLSETLCYNAELIHPITLNGGALNLSFYSPLTNRGGVQHDMVCLQNIREGCEIKNTKIVPIGVHFPCGMAASFGLSARQTLSRFIEAKQRLRTSIPGVQPIMLVHVDYEGYKQKRRFYTHFFNRKKFEMWEQKHPNIMVA
jgi:hypothetical protein